MPRYSQDDPESDILNHGGFLIYAPYQTFGRIARIVSLFAFRPETAKPMRALAEVLRRGPNTLAPDEPELIANYVSSRNDCYFGQTSERSVDL